MRPHARWHLKKENEKIEKRNEKEKGKRTAAFATQHARGGREFCCTNWACERADEVTDDDDDGDDSHDDVEAGGLCSVNRT